MPKLNSVLADRQQTFDENEKAQARANIGAAAAADAGIKTVSTDSSLTGDGTPGSVLGVADYTGLASKDWVNQQGYITAQGSELTAGRGIRIAEHVISTPSACEMVFPIKVSDTLTVERPVTSLKEYRHKGAVMGFQQTLSDGPSDTLYAFNAVPINEGVYGLDNSGNWQQCMTGMPANITAESVTTYAKGPGVDVTARIDAAGLLITASGKRRIDDTEYVNYAGISDSNVWVSKDGVGYSLTADVATDATLTGGGFAHNPLGLAEDIDHRGTMQYVNAAIYQHGLGITGGNVRSTALYTSTQPMSGQYLLSWGAKGHSNSMHGNGYFIRVSVGPDWGKADSQGNYAFGGYDWYTRQQGIGNNQLEILGGSQMVYLTGQTSINISMALCSAWNAMGTPNYVNGSWAGMSDFHTGHWLSDVWVTLDKVGPYAGNRSPKYR